MKKIVFLSALLLNFSGLIQSVHAAYGVRIGLNYSSIAGDDANSDKRKWGTQIGLFREFKLTDRWGIQVEADYSTKGGIYKQFFTEQNSLNIIGEMEDVFHFQYFEVPVLLKYCHPITHNNAIGLLAGVHVSYLIAAHDKQSASENLGVKEMEFDLRPVMNKIDYGLIFGMEYEFSLFRVLLIWDIRYDLGMRALFKESDWNAEHHRLFSSCLGIRF